MVRITAREARDSFGDVIARAQYGDEPIIVTKQGKPAVAIVNYEEYIGLYEQRNREAIQSLLDDPEARQVLDRLLDDFDADVATGRYRERS
jgi:prevent-host-death family protein